MSVLTLETPPSRVMLLIPGLNDPNATGLLRMAPVFEQAGYVTEAITYGCYFLRGMAWEAFNPPLAEMLSDFAHLLTRLGHEVHLTAHSNGAAIALAATERGAPLYSVSLINGAVETDARIGPNVKWVLDLTQPIDPVLVLSSAIPFSPWGLGGVIGIKGDPRVQNISLREFGHIRWHGGGISREHAPLVAGKIVEGIEQTRSIPSLKS